MIVQPSSQPTTPTIQQLKIKSCPTDAYGSLALAN